MAVALMHLERYEECAAVVRDLIAVDPDYGDAYVVLARCCREMGNNDLAKWYARKRSSFTACRKAASRIRESMRVNQQLIQPMVE